MTNPQGESISTLTTSIANNGSIVIGALQPSAMIPTDHPPALINSSTSAAATMNKSLDAKKSAEKQNFIRNFSLIIDLRFF